MTIRYPEVSVQLSGEDGNVFAIIGRVAGALRKAKVPADAVKQFQTECMSSGSYDEVLQTCMKWVDCN